MDCWYNDKPIGPGEDYSQVTLKAPVSLKSPKLSNDEHVQYLEG